MQPNAAPALVARITLLLLTHATQPVTVETLPAEMARLAALTQAANDQYQAMVQDQERLSAEDLSPAEREEILQRGLHVRDRLLALYTSDSPG